MCKTNIRIWGNFHNTRFGHCHHQTAEIAELFYIRLALRLPKYISTRLLHEASGLPYVKDRLLAVATGQLRNSSRNPLVEHTINTAMSNYRIHIPAPLTLIRTD